MKKLGLLIAGTFLVVACDATPKGNRSILPVEHDEAVEHVDHHEGHDTSHDNHEGHGDGNHETHTSETKDSLNAPAGNHTEKKDSAH